MKPGTPITLWHDVRELSDYLRSKRNAKVLPIALV